MGEVTLLAVYCLAFAILLPLLNDARLNEASSQPDLIGYGRMGKTTYLISNNKCAFYCFYVPSEEEARQDYDSDQMFDYENYSDVHCTHLVYGYSTVRFLLSSNNTEIISPTRHDILPYATFGNFRRITDIARLPNGPKVLLGFEQSWDARFVEDGQSVSSRVAHEIVRFAAKFGFGGIFIKFPVEVISQSKFVSFLQSLGEAVSKGRHLLITLSISPRFFRIVNRNRIGELITLVDAFYVAEQRDYEREPPEWAQPVDPLYHNRFLSSESYGLLEMAEQLAKSGVPRQKIIVGLSAWTESYVLVNTSSLPARVAEWGRPAKLAYQEFCLLRGLTPIRRDQVAKTMTTAKNFTWFSMNLPFDATTIEKLKLLGGFGGLGVFSLQGDDPSGTCRTGKFPLHKQIEAHLQCATNGSGMVTEARRAAWAFEFDEKLQSRMEKNLAEAEKLHENAVRVYTAYMPMKRMRIAAIVTDDPIKQALDVFSSCACNATSLGIQASLNGTALLSSFIVERLCDQIVQTAPVSKAECRNFSSTLLAKFFELGREFSDSEMLCEVLAGKCSLPTTGNAATTTTTVATTTTTKAATTSTTTAQSETKKGAVSCKICKLLYKKSLKIARMFLELHTGFGLLCERLDSDEKKGCLVHVRSAKKILDDFFSTTLGTEVADWHCKSQFKCKD